MIIWIYFPHYICTHSTVNCEHMQICLCWLFSLPFVWLGQEHVSLEGRARTAIKAHTSGFHFARSMRAASPKLTSAGAVQFFHSVLSRHCVSLCVRCCWIKMSWACVWEVPTSTQTWTCVCSVRTFYGCASVCVCVIVCVCVSDWGSTAKPQLTDAGTLTPSDGGVSIPSFSPAGWGRVEVVMIMVVVVGGG